jgi:hypothetical protein
MAVFTVAATTTITARPEQVWAVLDDFSGWPMWMPSMQNLRVELLSPGAPCLGYRFRLRGVLAYADLEVTNYTSLERATRFQLNLPPLKGSNSCLIEPLDDGLSRVERVDYLDLPGPLAFLIDVTQREYFERLAAEFLEALKHTVERSTNHADTRTAQ